MTTVTLGKTGITVNKNGFGALPIQRITKEEAAKLLRRHMTAELHISIRREHTLTVRKRSDMP